MQPGKTLHLDATDRELIALLRNDARMSVIALAQKLKVARATVQNRMSRLEKHGLIVGYTVVLRPEAESQRVRAMMSIEVAGNQAEKVCRLLRGNPNVVALHSTNGRWDLMAELRAETLEAFDEALHAVRAIDGIASTETSILLSTYKY